jgi:hypothetical protein
MARSGVVRLALTRAQGSGGDNNTFDRELKETYSKKKGAKKKGGY